jgi:pimeloyl-ACP methyl ester carboxylesterase
MRLCLFLALVGTCVAQVSAVAQVVGVAQVSGLRTGQIIDPVQCAADPSQTYALYLPSHYSAHRRWNLILAFDPRGQGRQGVEHLQAAAEKYGYIVAGSNNSRNGPPQVSLTAAQAMWTDVGKRLSINPKRTYTAGLSGGARIAMKVALDSDQIAGVIASSAGFPPGHRRSDLRFVVFGTAGTEDFNYLEMRQLDQELSSPHRVVIFEGGHTWLPSALAVEAVEWLELQAAHPGSFKEPQPDANAMNKDRQELEHEAQIVGELSELQQGLTDDPNARASNLKELKDRLQALSRQANAPADSPDRRMARRILGGIFIDSRSVDDQEYQNFVDTLRPAH